MFSRLSWTVGLWSFVFTYLPAHAENPKFGRYIGVLHHASINQEQLAKIDFIFTPTSAGDSPKISAILTLYFGSFAGGEYVSYFFQDVRLDVLTGRLVFNSDDLPLSIVTSKFADGELTASVRSKWSGNAESLLNLKQVESVTPALPIIEQIGGEYFGSCQGTETKLQLLPFRSGKNPISNGNPFSPYEIRGQILDRELPIEGKPFVNRDLIRAGSYNFFTGQLTLQTRKGKLQCGVGSDSIKCGDCEFSRPRSELSNSFSPKAEKTNPFNSKESLAGDSRIVGKYSGYIYHERLDRFQFLKLRIDLIQSRDPSGILQPTLTSSGQLLFGLGESDEYVPLHFNEISYPPIGGSQTIALTGSGTTVQLRPISPGVLRGIWYSHFFGRVGAIELHQENLDPVVLPDSSQIIEKLSGMYVNSTIWDLEIAARGESSSVETANPFAPNVIEGSFTARELTYPMLIVGGAYDYFTGAVALEMEPLNHLGSSIAVGPNPVWVGKLSDDGNLLLSLASGKWGTRDGFDSEAFVLRH